MIGCLDYTETEFANLSLLLFKLSYV